MSGLKIDDFYEQLKEAVERELIRQIPEEVEDYNDVILEYINEN